MSLVIFLTFFLATLHCGTEYGMRILLINVHAAVILWNSGLVSVDRYPFLIH